MFVCSTMSKAFLKSIAPTTRPCSHRVRIGLVQFLDRERFGVCLRFMELDFVVP